MWLGAGLAALVIVGGCTVAIVASPISGATIITGTVVLLATCYLVALSKDQAEKRENRLLIKRIAHGEALPESAPPAEKTEQRNTPG